VIKCAWWSFFSSHCNLIIKVKIVQAAKNERKFAGKFVCNNDTLNWQINSQPSFAWRLRSISYALVSSWMSYWWLHHRVLFWAVLPAPGAQLTKTPTTHSGIPIAILQKPAIVSQTTVIPAYEQRTLYGALVVTLAMLLRLVNCHYIYFYYFKTEHNITAG